METRSSAASCGTQLATGAAFVRRTRTAWSALPGRWLALLVALVAVFSATALAATVAVTVQGQTVTYSAVGLPVNTDVTVVITNTATGQATTQGPFNTGANGLLPTNTATCGTIAAGNTITVSVRNGANEIASGTATIPDNPQPVGDIVRWIGRIIDIFL